MRRHELNPAGLVFGIFFIGAAILWGTGDYTSSVGRGWQLPALLVTAGVIGLLSVLAKSSGRSNQKE